MKRDYPTPDPTDDSASQIAALSPDKRALLNLKLKKQSFYKSVGQTIPRGTNGSSAPLSFAQKRLWFLNQLAPGSPVYNVYRAWRLRGGLDVEALQRAIDTIVARHAVLRSIFRVVDGQPIQVTAAAPNVRLSIVDLQGLPPEEREAEGMRLTRREAELPFDLTQGPLFRVKLLRLADEDQILFLTLHHIVTDGWSQGVLHRELAALYDAFAVGKPSPLPDLPIQYSDYALWQRERLQGDSLEKEMSYWKQQLASLPVLELPTDRPRRPVQSHRGARVAFRLSATLTAQLKVLGQREGATLFMTLLAAVKALLYRYTGQVDIVVGTPIANRTRVELEPLIGMIVNSLVLRTDVSGDPSFRELLGRVRDIALGAYAHPYLPFEKLVEELRPERDMSRNPLFQVAFALQNTPDQALALSGLSITPFTAGSVSPFNTGNDTAKFDLTVSMVETDGSLEGMLEYSTDVFDSVTIRRMAGHLQVLLEGILANPEQRLSRLPLLTISEQHQLLVEWNETATDYPREQCIHKLFEAQVERTPEAIAVIFGEEQLTYRELNARANQLAHYLRTLGVGPDVLVGICLVRSVEMVVGLLGILKAGGAYLPLDPTYPKQRLALMLADSQVPVLLTQARLVTGLPEHQTRVVALDDDWETIATERQQNPVSGVTGDHLTYVIYTSGSTGTPKGVLIQHRSLVNHIHAASTVFALTGEDRMLQFASLSFDASAQEIFTCLTRGATLVLRTDLMLESAKVFLQQCQEWAITVLDLPTAYWHELTVSIEAERWVLPQSIRLVIIGGEKARPERVTAWRQQVGRGVRLVNAYGPTEATIATTMSELSGSAEDEPAWREVPIGRALPNAQTYVLDAHMNPVPVGVVGELHIGGAGLALGYLNRPELTAERFIPDPFSSQPGARLYKTGDLVRYLPDGTIEFFGRLDYQVKIRGYRIELGEVEAVLGQHPSVRESVVIVREDAPGEKRLVAYVVANRPPPRRGELHSLLREKLPEHMVPAAFVMLEALPLTPNGKVDRRALPLPDLTRLERERAYVAPRTSIEELVAGIWAEVLGVEQVSVYDNFFELGGHSLLATQVISRMLNALQVEVPLQSFFQSATVAALASAAEEIKEFEEFREPSEFASSSKTRAVSRRQEKGSIPLSFEQQRLWFLDQLEPHSPLYNIPQAIRMSGALKMEALRQALDAIVARHESLRTTFDAADGSPVQVIAPTLSFELPLIDLTGLPQSERETEALRLASEEAQCSFDLERGPLMRARLLWLGEEDHVLLLNMHHIVSDGWSRGVLFRELGALYEAFSQGKPSPLAELPIQYADYAVWQREWLAGERLEEQLSYWRKQLGSDLPALELPTDRPRPAVRSYQGAKQRLMLSKTVAEQLKALSQREGATLFMTLLAAFQTLLMRYTGQDDIVVGSAIAGRARTELEGLIGFFVNTLVLRGDLSGNPTFLQLLGRVKEMALGAYAHQALPFEKLVEELQPERSLNHTPLFQVMLTLQNAPRSLELSGLKLRPVEVARAIAKFDLTLSMVEGAEGLCGQVEYNTDLFEAATIRRMLGHFEVLLAGIVAEPEQRLSELPLLTEAERQQLLVEWNDTQAGYPQDKCVHELFEAQVGRTPEAIAVLFGEEQLTYRELNERANQLAHYLRKRGVGPEVLVGICMKRSLEMIVGLLGILKAGGAYLPLDPAYPQERLSFMLKDAEVKALVTQVGLVESLPAQGAEMVYLDTDWKRIVEESAENPVSGAAAKNLAYVIYTSGSTGRPKGVAIEHHSTVALLDWAREIFASEQLAGVLASTSICFDLSIFELFVPLSRGGMVILAESALHLPDLPASQNVTLINTVPSVMAELVRIKGVPVSVRTINLAGEPVQNALVQQIYQRETVQQVYNLYGPSEDTTYSTYALMKKGSSETPTIGRPITRTQVYILDRHMNPVPVGVPGELHIGGAGLARGYLNRPELTAERFIANPFSDEAGSRLYKTGDLARYLPDGQIEYLGRIDHQVKIRGYRIEPGEIEAVLGGHPAVHETVVVAREDVPGEKRLVAYLVAAGEAVPSLSELRSYLKERLPDYMVPSAFMLLDALPVTPNGKVDRRALPLPDRTRLERERAHVAPGTSIEKQVAGIWAEVLGVEQVSVYDNFFDLGGHSLKAIQVISRLREAFHLEPPQNWLFDSPTVSSLAEQIEIASRSEQGLQVLPIQPLPREGEQPLSFSQERVWFIQQLDPENRAYHFQSTLNFTGSLDVAALEQSLSEIIRRHEIFRTTFPAVDGHPVQVIHPPRPVNLPVIDLQRFPESERYGEGQRLANKEFQKPFDLTQLPLIRWTLLQLNQQEYVLLHVEHHLVHDGWSFNVFLRELHALYRAFSAGKPSPLSEMPIQFVDFARWQRQWMQEEVAATQRAYWKEKLAGSAPLLELPADHPRPAVQGFRGAALRVELPLSLCESLRALSRQAGVTLFMTMLATFLTLLHRYGKQDDICIGSGVANRRWRETEALIGMIVNTIALRTDLSGDPTFQELLGRVRKVTLEAYAHQDLPFGDVVAALRPERSLSYPPICQVLFSFHDSPLADLEFPGLTMSLEEALSNGSSKFDLNVIAIPRSEQRVGRGPRGGADGITLVWEYNTDLFDDTTITRMLGHFEVLLAGIVADPEQRLSELPLLSEAERHQLLVEWNDTATEYPKDKVVVDEIPLTPNGKVDRRALPAPGEARPELAGLYVEPRTELEGEVARVWAEVLKVERVGIYDNFFELGGHSLLATQVISRVRKSLQVELPLRSLFESPTVAALASAAEELIKELEESPERREFGSSAKTRTIPRREEQDLIPLSFEQQRLWFLDQLEPHSPLYNIPQAIRMSGALKMEALRQALDAIVARHESLRTTFDAADGSPVQVIAPTLSLELPLIDLTGLPQSKREAEALRLVAEEVQRPFDLSRGPLVRTTLLRLHTEEHILLLTMHHIISDGWSAGVFVREFTALYEAFVAGQPSPLAELPIQYADYAVWQRQWLNGEILEKQLSYWKEHLAGAPAVLGLTTDRPRPATQTFRGAMQPFTLSKSLSENLKSLSQQEGVTLFMTLLAAFQTLLLRYTGQDDIVVGSPIAGRNRAEIEGLIGFFVNTLALRADLSGNPTFRQLLRRVREVALGAYAHQELPFEKLIEELQPPRSMSHSPLFQVAFALNTPRPVLKLSGLTISPLMTVSKTAKFDLTLSVREEAERLQGAVEYNTDLFDATTIERMLLHFQSLLKGIVINPAQHLSELPLLTQAECHQLLVEWNNTQTEEPKDECVHELFEAQVERTPDAVAVVFEDEQLTYRQLNARANQLAHLLQFMGVRPEVLVGIYMERSLEMVVGLMGILKAGGAYVPLDPAYPQDRLRFVLEDAAVPILVTQARLVESLPEHEARIVCLDASVDVIADQSSENPISEATSENLVYVIYTSGSTGKPKGVAIEHQQLLNYLNGILERMELPAGASFAMVSTFAADLGNTVIFPSLCAGGCLHLISRERALDPEALADYFRRRPIDCVKIVPSHLAALQTSAHPEWVVPRLLLVLGGEASPADWVVTLQALAPHCTILNHYGPTEATVGALTYRVEKDQPVGRSTTLPLGRPIANTRVYLLDSHMNPVPIGVPGELFIGGAGLARGYLNRPELTLERFILNPFSDEPDARLYKTGDLARYLPDGNIEFLGRSDRQVKVRGFRVELAEIEAVLRQHPHLREAAVLAREDAHGNQRLIAYVVPSQEYAPTIAGHQRYKLPNNLAVAQLNKSETDYLYGEVFERQAYLKHGITLHDGDCIFDVGANIGLFALFANQICKNLQVYAFEPNPIAFEILSANASLYGSDIRLFKCGLSDQTKTAPFTFFQGFSLLSGFHADAETEKEVVKSFMRNQQRAGMADMADLIEQADEILGDRFAAQTFPAQLRTLSSVMEEEEIEYIDLLKINVEKSELDVLAGIKSDDWKKIKQIVLEADIKENLDKIVALLEQQGYDLVVEQDALLENTPLRYVYAIRPSSDRVLVRAQAEGAHIRTLTVLRDDLFSPRALKDFLSQRLPDYMSPSAFVVLDELPLTPNGKVDYRALPMPGQAEAEGEDTFVPPRTPTENLLAGIWAELLELERIGLHDNFFELGGHSLLVTRVISRVRAALRIDLPIRSLFETPTISGLAVTITQTQAQQEEAFRNVVEVVEGFSQERVRELLSEYRGESAKS